MTWMIRLSGDLTTKLHHTRRRFQRRLVNNLKQALESHGIGYRLHPGWSRLLLHADDARVPEVLAQVFGIHSFSRVHEYPLTTLEDLVAQGKALYAHAVRGKTYAVRARRAGQGPFSSMEVQVALGTALNAEATVNLTDPQVTVHVEVREGRVYFFSDQHPGPGGLPLGVEGKALMLVSGGFDSAVAAWMLLRRGLALDYAFFRLGGEAHERDVRQVVGVLARRWSHGTRPKLYVIPFEDVVAQIQDKVQTRYWQVVLKRQMYRTAQQLALRKRIHTLVTGESLGQVSSQTLANLEALSVAGSMLMLRPLIGFNKQDIIEKAYQIGTGELSAKVPEYCAIVPEQPSTSARSAVLDAEEAKLAVDVKALAVSAKRLLLVEAAPGVAPAAHAVTELPDEADAVLLDIRTEREFRRSHAPRAVHLDFAYALDFYDRLDKSKTYYVYCGVGLKSANLVDRMRLAGYRALVYQPCAQDEPPDVP